MKLLSTILIWLMVLPFAIQTIVFVNFQINRAEIAAKSCVNKAPESNCHGTCQLVKAIKKQEPEDNKGPFTPHNQKDRNEMQWFFEGLTSRLSISPEQKNTLFLFADSLVSDPFPDGVFHPPKA